MHAARKRWRECVWKQGERAAKESSEQRGGIRWDRPGGNVAEIGELVGTVIERETARRGAHEALPHPPPGGKPPETLAPFPSESMFQNGGNLSRVRKPRTNRAPLTDSLRSEDFTGMRERGPLARGSIPPPVGRPRPNRKVPAQEKPLDRDRPSHGSRDRQGVILTTGC